MSNAAVIEKKRSVPLALDQLEPGPENVSPEDEKVTSALPEGVTSGMLYKDIVRIAWPSFLELILTQIVSMADMMMVGGVGAWAISAIGLTNQPKFMLMTMIMALNVGATALVARYKGMGQPEKARNVLRQALLITFILAAIFSVIGLIFAEPLVKFMGAADAQTLEGGTIYLKIQMYGFIFMALTSTITATLRGVGNSRAAMIYNLIANGVNIIGNYLLIHGNLGFPALGVAGASLATIIGQFVAFAIATGIILGKRQYIYLDLKEKFRIDFEAIRAIIKIGLPAMLEQVIMRTGMIIYAKTVASLGTIDFAVHNICMNIQSLSFMNGQAFAVSATSLMGQSLGKRRYDMAQAYCSRTRRIGMYFSILLGLAAFFFGGAFVSLYNTDPYIIERGAMVLKIVALIQPLQSSQFIIAGALRGAGDTRATAVVSFITILLVRPGIAILLVNVAGWGLVGAWVALAADQCLRSLLILLRFASGKWKHIKVS